MELIQPPLPFAGETPTHPLSEVKDLVLEGITQGIKRTQMERELAEETFSNIMDSLQLTEPNPFSMRHYDVVVSLGYDTIFTLTNYEFDGDEDDLEQHITEELDVTIEVKYDISFGHHSGTYEDDGSMISHSPADQLMDELSIEITERD